MTHAWRCGLVTGYNLKWAVLVITIQIGHGCQVQYYGWVLYICWCTMSMMLVSHFFKNSQHTNKQVGTVRERKQRKRTVAQGHRKWRTYVVALLVIWSICEMNTTFFFWIIFAVTTLLQCRPNPEHSAPMYRFKMVYFLVLFCFYWKT